jgi:catechol 2,3-dioxygenase-like lactoylglutathione lyase family enzyme
MIEINGIDHIYITVSDMAVSERFYDRSLVDALGFRKNNFALDAEPHIQYACRHFGFVIRPPAQTQNMTRIPQVSTTSVFESTHLQRLRKHPKILSRPLKPLKLDTHR